MKHCPTCNKPITPNIYRNGKVESKGRVLKRTFCDRECWGISKRKSLEQDYTHKNKYAKTN